MGYAEPGQPCLIYAHHDTDNLHLHVVTSRMAPDGHKTQFKAILVSIGYEVYKKEERVYIKKGGRIQEELKQTLKAKLGIDLVFFGRKDAPYGHMLVDHAHKRVIHDARILSTEELLDFSTPN